MAAVLARSGASRKSRKATRRGFTLIETALATIIVGIGVLAMVSAQAAFHQKNAWSTHASIATHLANELREMTWNLPRHDPVTGDAFWGPEGDNEASFEDYDDLDDFDGLGGGLVFSPPINAHRQVIENMDGWSQTIRVFNVDPFNIVFDGDTLVGVAPDFGTDTIAMEVTIHYQPPAAGAEIIEMTRVTWISPR
jgi:prepilin-type N-terminal cleavage/methylation domain-containing protein